MSKTTVGELIKELEKYPKDLDVMTKKEDVFGTVGEVFSTKKDEYYFLGKPIPCVLIGDFESEDE